MPSLEYYMIEATDSIGGQVSMQDFIDAITEMKSSDWPQLHDALKTNDETQIGHLVMRMIRRNNEKRINDAATTNYLAHLDACILDAEEQKRELTRERSSMAI